MGEITKFTSYMCHEPTPTTVPIPLYSLIVSEIVNLKKPFPCLPSSIQLNVPAHPTRTYLASLMLAMITINQTHLTETTRSSPQLFF